MRNIKEKPSSTLILVKIGSLVLTILLFISMIKSISRLSNARKKIVATKKQVEELSEEHQKLEDNLSEVKSDFFIEKEARDKLGYSKEGETVVILPDDEVLRRMVPSDDLGENFLPDPTWKQWINLFL